MHQVEQCQVEQSEVGLIDQTGSSGVRTIFVFLDLPVHLEFRALQMPLIPEGLIIEFDNMKIRYPADRSGREWIVQGPHQVARRKCVYSSRRPSLAGLTQYLEMRQVT